MLTEAHSAQRGLVRRRVCTDVEVLVCEIRIREQCGLMPICQISKSDKQDSNRKTFFFSHVSLNPPALLSCLSCVDVSFACASTLPPHLHLQPTHTVHTMCDWAVICLSVTCPRSLFTIKYQNVLMHLYVFFS